MLAGEVVKTLIQQGVVQEEQVERAQREAERAALPILEYLSEENLIHINDLLRAQAEVLRLRFCETLDEYTGPKEFLEQISLEFCRNNQVVAIEYGEGVYYIATANPSDFYALDDLAGLLNCQVETVVAPTHAVRRLIDQAYHATADTLGALDELSSEEEGSNLHFGIGQSEDLLDVANRAPVIRFVNSIFTNALQKRASDIHFQPMAEGMRVRFRVDGVLYDYITLPKENQDAVVSRLKVMSRLDIAEKRSTQDGRTALRFSDREIDVRVSIIPTVYGEQVVMRLLDKEGRLYSLEKLGLNLDDEAKMRSLIQNTHGIILTTGPTGSGKTTTLYASLMQIDSDRKNIITIEDPIEYQLPGISQIQVEPKKNVTFATGLRSVLRQDPDVLMVGEIRDFETATNAIQSALTGHLVFSTLHTNDSAGAMTRMMDLGIEPYLVSSSVIGVIAQRLIRKICPHCREALVPEEESLNEIGLTLSDLPDGVVYHGTGCDECMQSGYYDRVGIYEIIIMNHDIEQLVLQRSEASAIKRLAMQSGMQTLRMNGGKKGC
jgi:general secretion pathway protein E